MMPGFLPWVTKEMASPSSVIVNADGSRPRGFRRKVNTFDLDE